MKKIFDKKTIITVMISGIIFTCVGVYASSYLASDISYSPIDSSWEVSNVSEALNDLYSNTKNTGGNLYYLGDCSKPDNYSAGTGTFDVSGIEGYEKFTVDNFISADGLYMQGYVVYPNRPFSSSTVKKEYDATTGILTVTLPSTYTSLSDAYGGNHYMSAGSAKVYLYTGETKSLN